MTAEQVVVTGLGAITPLGNSIDELWVALTAGRSGAGPITVLDPSAYGCQIGGEVRDFAPEAYLTRKKLRNMPTASQYAVVAAHQALDHAGLDLQAEDSSRVGVLIGTAGGNTIDQTERAAEAYLGVNDRSVSAFFAITVWPNIPAFFIAEQFGLQGYNGTVCTACAAGTQAIGEAAAVILRGDADVMVAGGSDQVVSHTLFTHFSRLGAFPVHFNDRPEAAMRPFDAGREGFIPGMGAGILILEAESHARARGARPLARILGLGVSNDAFNLIAPDPDGRGAALALHAALENAGVAPEQVDYINAHGTSTPLGDASETRAIKAVFGETAYDVPISSTKSMIGHLMGAAGAVEALVCVLTMQAGLIHPTINYETPDPHCDLDYVPNQARAADVEIAVSNSFGLGGQNAVLVLGRGSG